MPQPINDWYLICDDCLQIVAYDDPSSLDFHYGRDAQRRLDDVHAGLEAAGGYVCVGETEFLTEQYPESQCHCCRHFTSTFHRCEVWKTED